MHIDPYAWIITLPLTLALVQLYFQPSDFVLKRWWRQIQEWESQAWTRLLLIEAELEARWRAKAGRVVHALAVGGLAMASLASLAAFVGLLPTA